VKPAVGRGRAAGWLLAAVLTALAIVGITRLRIDDDLRSLVRGAGVNFQLLDEVAALFGAPDRDCIVRATATAGDLFDSEPLAELQAVVERLRQVPGVDEVRSIFDVRRQGAAGAVLPVIPRTPGGLDAAARKAARERVWMSRAAGPECSHSLRLSKYFTGRPEMMEASATTCSTSTDSLAPKPPPTSPAST